jgi:hypothetical protein
MHIHLPVNLNGRDHLEEVGVCSWEDSIKMKFREIRWEGVELDSPGSGYGPVANSCEYNNKLAGFFKDGQFIEQTSFQRRTLLHGGTYLVGHDHNITSHLHS